MTPSRWLVGPTLLAATHPFVGLVGGVSLAGGLRALSGDSGGSLSRNGWLLAVAAALVGALAGVVWWERSGQR